LTHRILLVDGDPISSKAMCDVLRRAQYEVACSQTGQSGLTLATRFDPDVLLVDLKLQDMSGLDLLRQVRRQDSRPACVLITRFGHDEDRAEAMRLGAFDCIEQPLTPGLLLAVVHSAQSGCAETGEIEQSHALARWADVVVRGLRSPTDMPTLETWGRTVAASTRTIRNWCYTARVPARHSLQFMRALRAVIRQGDAPMTPEDLLDIVDRRTLAKLLTLAGGTRTTLPGDVDQFFERQRIITNPKAVTVVRAVLVRNESNGRDRHASG